MSTQTFDDGSTLEIFDDGSTLSTSAVDAGGSYTATSTSSQDSAEAAKFSQFYPDQGKPWWEQLAMYGATRAIDSHFATTSVDKTVTPITAAGQSGQTYSAGNTKPGTVMGVPVGAVVLAGAVLAALALSH